MDTSEILYYQNIEYEEALRKDIEREEQEERDRKEQENQLTNAKLDEEDDEKLHLTPKSLRNKRLLYFEKYNRKYEPEQNTNEQSYMKQELQTHAISQHLSTTKIYNTQCTSITKLGKRCKNKSINSESNKCRIHFYLNVKN